jgi:REP element-mobilizing transposase RayT
MPRAPRDEAAGVHHIVMGATGPSPYYVNVDDRLTWLRMFVRALDRYGWTCVGFCQMTTHVHALVEVPPETLAQAMHWLNSRYGLYFNDAHDRKGALLRSRYWSARMETDEQLLAAFAYVALNPVRALICARPEAWRWGSFATSCKLAASYPFVDASLVCSVLNAGTDPAPALLNLVALEATRLEKRRPVPGTRRDPWSR